MRPRRSVTTTHIPLGMPRMTSGAQQAWVADTYALLDSFESERRSKHGRPITPAAGFVIAASDYLWERFQLEAAWNRFETEGLFGMFAPFFAVPGWTAQCVAALREFFTYLERLGIVDADSAARVQAELARDPKARCGFDPATLDPTPMPLNRAHRRALAHARRLRSFN